MLIEPRRNGAAELLKRNVAVTPLTAVSVHFVNVTVFSVTDPLLA